MEKQRKTLLELCEEAGYPIKKRKKKKIEISTRDNFTDCHCENRRNRDDDEEFY